MPTVYAVLYTHQKTKKSKTWQDGIVKYWAQNSKANLYDEKGSKLDSYFVKGNKNLKIGEQYEFDRHLVTLDNFLRDEQENIASGKTSESMTVNVSCATETALPRLGEFAQRRSPLSPHTKHLFSNNSSADDVSASCPLGTGISTDKIIPAIKPTAKRRRVGLSHVRPASSAKPSVESALDCRDPPTDISESVAEPVVSEPISQRSSPQSAPKKVAKFQTPPPSGISFPSSDACCRINPFTAGQPMRRLRLSSRFASEAEYRDSFIRLVNEHLQVLLQQLSLHYNQTGTRMETSGGNIKDKESYYRSKGCNIHIDCSIMSRSASTPYCPGKPHIATRVQRTPNFVLTLKNKQRSSMYSKDDLWIISNSQDFEPNSTFLARSNFYGVSSNNTVELRCLSLKDAATARNLTGKIFAIRAVNCTAEFLMLDTLQESTSGLICPLIPALANWAPKSKLKAGFAPQQFRPPSRARKATQCVNLTKTQVDVRKILDAMILEFSLNEDQASVFENFARYTVRASEWECTNPLESPPLLLVHGVFGAGKSYLVSVLIIFLSRMIEASQEDQNRNVILICALTNVAVDRILQGLLELGFRDFVRVGSLRRIAKPVLPFTAQGKAEKGDEIKELEAMLKEENLSLSETKFVQETLKRFKKKENRDLVSTARIVGTTCMAACFEMFDNLEFSLAILDESSQIAEPMALVPLCRLRCNFAVLVGDPKQLPPTLVTTSHHSSLKQGLDRTMFDRAVEMGIKPIMLRTQYRCHPRISAVSNELFYDRELMDGVNHERRLPLVKGLPVLCFVEIAGEEQQHQQTRSYFNTAEVDFIVHLTVKMRKLGVSSSEIGVICLYKAQADAILHGLCSSNGSQDGVQVSTVDAFQGAEKNIIILSCVRTKHIGFIDNEERVNVAITRAKRHLIITGNTKLMSTSKLWSKIIDNHCKKSGDGYLNSADFRNRMGYFSLNTHAVNETNSIANIAKTPDSVDGDEPLFFEPLQKYPQTADTPRDLVEATDIPEQLQKAEVFKLSNASSITFDSKQIVPSLTSPAVENFFPENNLELAGDDDWPTTANGLNETNNQCVLETSMPGRVYTIEGTELAVGGFFKRFGPMPNQCKAVQPSSCQITDVIRRLRGHQDTPVQSPSDDTIPELVPTTDERQEDLSAHEESDLDGFSDLEEFECTMDSE